MNVLSVCSDIMPVLRIIAYLLEIVQWAIPILLIAFVTFDFVKSMMANDEKAMESVKSTAVKRLVYAVVVFLVPVLIRIVFKMLGGGVSAGGLSGPTDWITCFEQALNSV